jgi:hypothetical protein
MEESVWWLMVTAEMDVVTQQHAMMFTVKRMVRVVNMTLVLPTVKRNAMRYMEIAFTVIIVARLEIAKD